MLALKTFFQYFFMVKKGAMSTFFAALAKCEFVLRSLLSSKGIQVSFDKG